MSYSPFGLRITVFSETQTHTSVRVTGPLPDEEAMRICSREATTEKISASSRNIHINVLDNSRSRDSLPSSLRTGGACGYNL